MGRTVKLYRCEKELGLGESEVLILVLLSDFEKSLVSPSPHPGDS